jgi:uncharacterized protein (DUF362 family)
MGGKTQGVILAGSDQIAIDVIGVAILRSTSATPELTRGEVFDQYFRCQ